MLIWIFVILSWFSSLIFVSYVLCLRLEDGVEIDSLSTLFSFRLYCMCLCILLLRSFLILVNNNKGIRTTSLKLFWCLYLSLWTDFTLCSVGSNNEFEQVTDSWVKVITKWNHGIICLQMYFVQDLIFITWCYIHSKLFSIFKLMILIKSGILLKTYISYNFVLKYYITISLLLTLNQFLYFFYKNLEIYIPVLYEQFNKSKVLSYFYWVMFW